LLTHARRCLLLVVNPAQGGAREVTPAAAERYWREAHTSGAASSQGSDEGGALPQHIPDAAFDIVYCQSPEEAARAVQNALLDFRHAPDQATCPERGSATTHSLFLS
jgi:hypothetical protein